MYSFFLLSFYFLMFVLFFNLFYNALLSKSCFIVMYLNVFVCFFLIASEFCVLLIKFSHPKFPKSLFYIYYKIFIVWLSSVQSFSRV